MTPCTTTRTVEVNGLAAIPEGEAEKIVTEPLTLPLFEADTLEDTPPAMAPVGEETGNRLDCATAVMLGLVEVLDVVIEALGDVVVLGAAATGTSVDKGLVLVVRDELAVVAMGVVDIG